MTKQEKLLEQIDVIQVQLNELRREVLEVQEDGTDPVVVAAKKTAPAEPTLEEVRSVLAEKARAGFSGQVRQLILNRGVHKLSEIPASEYKTIMVEAEALK